MIPDNIKEQFLNNGWEMDEYGGLFKMKTKKCNIIINGIQEDINVLYTLEFNTIKNADTDEIEFYGYRVGANDIYLDEYFESEEEVYDTILKYI